MGVCDKIVPNTFVKTEKSFTIGANGTGFVIIFGFSSVFFEKSFNHFFFEFRSNRSVNLFKDDLIRSICSHTSIMLFPKNPDKLGTYNILTPFLQINLNWCIIGLTVLVRVDILPLCSFFHDDDSGGRKLEVWVLYFHLSLVLLIKRQHVSTALGHFHLQIVWLVPTKG